MKKLIRSVALAGIFTAMAFAETWSGTLVDAACAANKKSSVECAPTASTSAFALVMADGKTVKLDAAGNSKAADAIKSSADRSKTPDAKKAITAKVTGTLSGDTIQAESVDVE